MSERGFPKAEYRARVASARAEMSKAVLSAMSLSDLRRGDAGGGNRMIAEWFTVSGLAWERVRGCVRPRPAKP